MNADGRQVAPQLGGWWAMCCIQDLYQIRTEEDLADVTAILNDDEPMGARYWPTLQEALAELEDDSLDPFDQGMVFAIKRHLLPPDVPVIVPTLPTGPLESVEPEAREKLEAVGLRLDEITYHYNCVQCGDTFWSTNPFYTSPLCPKCLGNHQARNRVFKYGLIVKKSGRLDVPGVADIRRFFPKDVTVQELENLRKILNYALDQSVEEARKIQVAIQSSGRSGT